MAAHDIISTRASRCFRFFGLQRSTVGALAMVVLVGMGERMAERFLPIYIMALGGGVLAIGLLQAMDNLLSALYSFPGGYLADRIGIKKSLLIFNLVAMAGFALVILIPTWQAVLIGAVFFISWSAISLPAAMSLTYKVLPQNKRIMGVSMHSLVRRIPMALGPLLGGLFIGIWGEREGVRFAFGAALALAAVALILQQRMIADDTRGTNSAAQTCDLTPEKNPLKLLLLMNPSMKGLLVTDILVRFCEQIPYAFVVVWCIKTIAQPVSALQFGLLTTIEMATAVLVYIPVAYLADRSTKKPFVLMTFVFFTLFPLVLLYSRHIWLWWLPAFCKEPPRTTELLLVVDQFEELFTLAGMPALGRFIELIETAVATPKVRVIATMRADFTPNVAEMPALARLFQGRGIFLLPAPGMLGLAEIIRRPAWTSRTACASGY